MVRAKIKEDTLGHHNLYIVDLPMKRNKIQGNIIKSFETRSEADKWLRKWTKHHKYNFLDVLK